MIMPVPKVLTPVKVSDFSPENLLSAVDKVLVVIVYEQLKTFLEKNKLILMVKGICVK